MPKRLTAFLEMSHRTEQVKIKNVGPSLEVQWLRFCASATGDAGSTPGQGTKIPHATQHTQNNKTKQKRMSASLLRAP